MNEFEDDVIVYNSSACKNRIASLRADIEELTTLCSNLVDKLFVFQTINHDVEGTAISEDYKDIGVIFSDQGFNNFVTILEQSINGIEETVDSWDKTMMI